MYLLLALFFSASLHAVESITQFKSDITIHTDGSMTVREDITANVELRKIRRGIVREFPTTYKDKRGNWYRVGFDVQGVMIDGKGAPYFIEFASNGKLLNFGDDTYLTRGQHTFTVIYKTNRQLGFYENHDELYWNVTGNGWRLPIDRLIARVHLPASISDKDIRWEAYTGRYGSRQKNVVASPISHGVQFTTTQRLGEFEGLTIVVGWPKGFIESPSGWQEWQWFFDDNKHIFLLGFGWVLLLAYLLFMWMRIRAKRLDEPIIPLFYPPKGMLPGGMRYFMRMGYDSVVLASDVVNMAVGGWLTIDQKKGWWGSKTYTLQPKESKEGDSTSLYEDIFLKLFPNNKPITLGSSNNRQVQDSISLSERYYGSNYDGLFDYCVNETIGAMLITFVFGVAAVLVAGDGSWMVWATIGYFIPIIIFYNAVKGYTRAGMKLHNDVEGFKLFLATTETDRLKVIGTPPTKTPELYEAYLPYAMALGVEEQWSAQFAPLFEKLRQAGNPYVPMWAIGWDAGAFRASSFASSMSSSMSSAISSSASRPGSGSGFSGGSGGGGFSGGGGGGGGGGGR